jgi:orotate phosphoribosyltransferase
MTQTSTVADAARQELLNMIHKVTDVYTGKHFVYTSGTHGHGYVNYRALKESENAQLLFRAGLSLWKKIVATTDLDNRKPIVIVGPETLGALMIKSLYGDFLKAFPNIHAIELRKTGVDKEFIWEDNLVNIIDSETQLVWFDDLLNRTSTLEATKPMIEALGARIHTVAVIGDRSGKKASEIGVGNIVSLERFSLTAYEEQDCPLCNSTVPIVCNFGHGGKYRNDHPDYLGGFIDL